MKAFFAYDLGTGGLKAVALDRQFGVVKAAYAPICTYGDGRPFSEQRPYDWAVSFAKTTKELLNGTSFDISGIAISGHSLGVVPVMKDCEISLGRDFLTPIWSDHRAEAQAKSFFGRVDRDSWYEKTGCGLTAEIYAIFKLMWIRENQPDIYDAARCFVGTKDYINYLLSGVIATDRSYASGSGAYDLRKHEYCKQYIEAAGLDVSKLPEVIAGQGPVGVTHGDFCLRCGLPEGIPVFAGGVDNVCSTVGAGAVSVGDSCISLGSSAQYVNVTAMPQIDAAHGVFVWDMGTDSRYATSVGTMSACTSLRWVVSEYFPEFHGDYSSFDSLAAQAAPGSGGLLFYPEAINGIKSWKGDLTLFSKAEMARSVLEGIAFSVLKVSGLRPEKINEKRELCICGGGSRSPIWMQMFADIFGLTVTAPPDHGNCAAIGAAALVNVLDKRDLSGANLHISPEGSRYVPDASAFEKYRQAFECYLRSED